MLIGYVSDDNYVAIAGALVEIVDGSSSVATSSRASGAVYADISPGTYTVYLSCPGFGSKRTSVALDGARPVQFRLLRERLLGYAWPKWVRAGEPVEMRVHSPEAYRLELWRYGWDKHLVRHLGYDSHAPDATRHVVPDDDYTRTGVGWRDPHTTTAPTTSGLYFFHVHTASGAYHGFPLVVAPVQPTAPLAVLTSSLTWNAYNSFGGRSNYIDAEKLPPRPSVDRRQDLARYAKVDGGRWLAEDYAPLSFDRPEPFNSVPLGESITDPVTGRDACGLASAEWRTLGWLEREGFGYDLYSDVQLHTGALDLDAYRVLLLDVHPEYWSRAMFDRVANWVRQHGGRLLYLGGNGINCEVELLDEYTMVVHNGDDRVLDPARDKLESRFGMRYVAEASLLGVGFTRAGMMTGAPYRVTDATHWAFEGTGLRDGDVFGTTCLHTRCPGGASGHEMDKMTPSSPPSTRLLAKGTNPGGSGAEMVHYSTANGGEVFSVGSINYACSLPVDDAVSRITANVLRKFLT